MQPARALPPAPTGVTRRSSSDQAIRYIRRLVFDGVLRPGDRVPQDQVAQTLGLSRIPVREALIALERDGWVTIELHRGAFINAISASTVQDHYELYGMIYGFAARRALSRGASDFPERLAKVADSLRRSQDPLEMSTLSVDFHNIVMDEAHNRRIGVLVRGLSALVPGAFFVEVPDAIAEQKRGISAITRAVRARDPDRVAEAYSKVMRQMGDRVVEVFERRGLFG
jgi:DNA-binding GntR family transcriptional regulator